MTTIRRRSPFGRVGIGIAGIAMSALLLSVPAYGSGQPPRDPENNGHGHAYGHDRHDEAQSQGNAPAHAGGPGDRQAEPPGQAKADGQPAQPAHAQGAKPPKRSRPARQGRPSRPGRPAGRPAKPARSGAGPVRRARPAPVAPPATVRAGAGTTTICHATGSDANPYVTITISSDTPPAHGRHQAGRDVIPAPAGTCPEAATNAARPARSDARIDAAPQEAESGAGVLAEFAAGPAAGAPASVVTRARFAGTRARFAVLGATISGGPELKERIDEVRTARLGSATDAPGAISAWGIGQLPFTGLQTALLALLGLLLMLIGMLVRQLGPPTPAAA